MEIHCLEILNLGLFNYTLISSNYNDIRKKLVVYGNTVMWYGCVRES